jgi:RecA/RadA recombinase
LATLGERLLELVATDGSASLSYAMALALEAQCAHEPVVWICQLEHGFSCADAEASGLDLSSMPVIRVDSAQNCGRVADKLLRSGAFALAIVELGAATLPAPLLARLGGLARRYNCTVLFLTERQKANSTLGSLISVRAESTRQRDGEYFSCRLQALKDRRCAPDWQLTQRFRGPAGL